MDNALDVTYRVVEGLFGPESSIPWWAWVAPLLLIFWTMLMPSVAPAAAGGGKKGKKGKADKKPPKRK
ncbi:hypothetical protein AMIS_13810 [Actinoplanes missouriensis 431]|uniref:Transmembrane protein n=1 Tax=Actinoplanes missouriensis (strain ATCC 14538 / DSM 43046 / CBS 188.64 / JCM 3121 / NBRC 102363 / NCIMB 12654 / NRRL B-3342 / UNCC 431) TaxID=512565 RepID=I0H0R4_ACTM4|nr:hypothetical protein [Actinoplanes missouriensis]BAL86601.1 hypothetical protein AMIS_13810 [Actinoplanes missouriensis 431]